MNNPIIYIDGFNLFKANYHSNTSVDTNGELIGGVVGFVVQLKNIIQRFSPIKIVIVFDGPNASFRRRQICKEYKSKRVGRTTSTFIKISDDENIEVNNEAEQLQKLYEILKFFPVDIIIVPYFEADDIIAYLVQKNKPSKQIIISNDNDYLQLVDDNTYAYQFSKKRIVKSEEISEEFNIIPENIIFYRSIVGDKSDELIGIKGIGKDLITKIGILSESKINSIGEFIEKIEKLEENKSKKIKLLKESKKQILLMYTLMKLDYSNINIKAIEVMKEQFDKQKLKTFSFPGFQIYCTKNKLNFHFQNSNDFHRIFAGIRNNRVILNV